MTVPPDILIILALTAVLLIVAFVMDKHVHKSTVDVQVKLHPTPKVVYHPKKKQEE